VQRFLAGVPIILVGLKSDLSNDERDFVSASESRMVQRSLDLDSYHECSALRGHNVAVMPSRAFVYPCFGWFFSLFCAIPFLCVIVLASQSTFL
jgi:hypothetical protein